MSRILSRKTNKINRILLVFLRRILQVFLNKILLVFLKKSLIFHNKILQGAKTLFFLQQCKKITIQNSKNPKQTALYQQIRLFSSKKIQVFLQRNIFFYFFEVEEFENPVAFNPIIQKEPELKNKSKIDVTKEKILFVPSSLKKKEPLKPE